MDEKNSDNLRRHKQKETKLFKNKIRAARDRTERKQIAIMMCRVRSNRKKTNCNNDVPREIEQKENKLQ